MSNQTQPNKPVTTLRDGALKATIWRNDGENGPRYSVILSRSFKDKDETWRDSHSFSNGELLRVSFLAAKAYDQLGALRDADRDAEAADAADKGGRQ